MKVVYSDVRSGLISCISTDRFEIPFASGMGPSLRIVRDGMCQKLDLQLRGAKYDAHYDGCDFFVEHTVNADEFVITVTASNVSDRPFSPESLDFSIGIDTYMVDYPEFMDKFFPTMLRCEKTHLYGYFMSPAGNACAVASEDPVASYTMMYNDMNAEEYGHRIHTAIFNLLHAGPLPDHHPQNLYSLQSGETRVWRIHLIPLDSMEDFPQIISKRCGIPAISAEQYTLSKGQRIQFQVHSNDAYRVSVTGPHGQEITSGEVTEFGLYTVKAVTGSGKEAEAKFFCRQSWDWYLKQARREAIAKPQKATTHTESWYGFFSGFLAAKHYPDAEQDRIISSHFEEVLPYMFDLEKKEPLVRPERIQNTACMISALVDKYEAAPRDNRKDLMLASALGDWIMTRQKQDGGYYCDKVLYTSVIYIAKSMLELAEAEKNAGMREEYLRHYRSAGAAIQQLAEKLDHIETEGEQTFEDGMISCSVLQLGMYALTLPESQRQPYIAAAQYLDGHHACLEQKHVPDCRVNGGSIRFWEGQYDVMFRANFICSPHGWSAWTAYGKYYLYLLTGQEKYLKELFNLMGACVQLMSLNGELRWAFLNDPYITGRKVVPDLSQPVTDGYTNVRLSNPAYRGKYENVTAGEEYIEMISSWYRTGEQKITGGYPWHPVYYADRTDYVDSQGGACDNDVHEIFKCMEETVLKKAFIVEREDGSICAYNCSAEKKADHIDVLLHDDAQWLHANFKTSHWIHCAGRQIYGTAGREFYDLTACACC